MWQARGLNECSRSLRRGSTAIARPASHGSLWLAGSDKPEHGASDAKSDANRVIEDNHAGDSWCGAPQPSRRRASPAVAAVAP